MTCHERNITHNNGKPFICTLSFLNTNFGNLSTYYLLVLVFLDPHTSVTGVIWLKQPDHHSLRRLTGAMARAGGEKEEKVTKVED